MTPHLQTNVLIYSMDADVDADDSEGIHYIFKHSAISSV